ncbi:MAG: hypothetical protein ACOX6S_00635 [Clostridia bacterium]|jgi:xanthine/uracil permease
MNSKGIRYGLEDRPPLPVTVASSLQWFIFIMLNNIVPPIAVGNMYGMAPHEILGFVQRTIFWWDCFPCSKLSSAIVYL